MAQSSASLVVPLMLYLTVVCIPYGYIHAVLSCVSVGWLRLCECTKDATQHAPEIE